MRVGVIGAGPMGRLHAQTIHRLAVTDDSFRLARILDRHDGRAEALAEELDAKPSVNFDSFCDQVDIAVVAVPTAGHFDLSTALIDRGIDVLIEKPLASKVSEGEALMVAADASDRVLQVGHVEWFNPAWRAASGRIGRIHRVEVERLQPPSNRGRDIDVVEDLMLHDLDWTTRLVAEPIIEIRASGRRRGGDLLDEVEAEIRFEGGCVARLHASRIDVVRRREVIFAGSAGEAKADLDGLHDPKPATPGRLHPTLDRAIHELRSRDPLESQWLEFVHACRERTEPINSGRVGVDALRLVEQVRAAVGRNAGGSDLDDDSRLRG